MAEKPYHLFSSADFLEDADFMRYVKFKLREDTAFWENWKNSFPENIDEFDNAALQLSLILSSGEFPYTDLFKDNLLSEINNSINFYERKKRKQRFLKIMFSGIASLVLITAFIGWYALSTIVVHSGYGKKLTVQLPDGSEVNLNSNSTLSYPRAFNWRSDREVTIKGEGYFKVRHINTNPSLIDYGDRFIARTREMTVRVLGTEFNIKNRRTSSSIALIKGKVQVTSKRSGKTFVMEPGDFIDFDATGDKKSTSSFNDDKIAWLTGKIIVNQTSVNDILRDFEDLYGYKVVLDSPALGNKKIDGAISIKNEDNVLFMLKNILNVDVQKHGKTIYLKNR
jgi:transmembrane sensor